MNACGLFQFTLTIAMNFFSHINITVVGQTLDGQLMSLFKDVIPFAILITGDTVKLLHHIEKKIKTYNNTLN